ncbi:MAG: CvpA family protein [Pirellula sp.]|jgi:membrane protein required for colicin V production|nr:CvpA family protein [Pirellula sp.]
MQTYDIVMLIVLASTTIFGAIKGFAWQLASVASIVASYFVAYFFRNDVAKMINADPPWNLFLAMLLLYFGSSFVIWMAFRLVSTSIDKIKLRDFDRQLGAGFGLVKGVLICLLITMFAMTLLGPAQQQRIANSSSGRYISRFLANADGLLPKEIKQVVGPYLDNVEKKLQQGQMSNGQFGTDTWGTNPSSPLGFPVNSGAGQGGILDNLGRMAEQGGITNPFGANPNNTGNNSNGAGGGFWNGPSTTPSTQPPATNPWPANNSQNNTWPNGNTNPNWPNDILPR